ncbi:MAG: sulfatase [Candidatus Binatia bacterium]
MHFHNPASRPRSASASRWVHRSSRGRIGINAAARLLTATFLGLLASCTHRNGPNVVLITIDTLRADHLSCYGYTALATPHIDQLAADGVLFDHAFCDVTWTTPSMCSVMTGTYPTIHGFKSTDVNQLKEGAITLAEVLHNHGYTTAAVVGSFPLDHIYGLNQGFQEYDDHFTAPLLTGSSTPVQHVPSVFHKSGKELEDFRALKVRNDSCRSDPEVTAAATAWLQQNSSRRFFLWVHYFGPHDKPDLRRSAQENFQHHLDTYDSDLAGTDAEVGRLLQQVDDLQLTEKTLVIMHADHGESLGEHDTIGHGTDLYEPTLQVPLIMRFPRRLPKGVRVQKLVRNVDIFPTVLNMLQINFDHELSGESLLPLMLWNVSRNIRETYTETYFPAHGLFATEATLADGSKRKVGLVRRGVRTTRWKYVRTEPFPIFGFEDSARDVPAETLNSLKTEELYDLATDSAEAHSLAAERPDVLKELGRHLDQYLDAERRAPAAPRVEIDAAAKERLRSLGYSN